MVFKQQNRSIPIPQPAWNFKLLILIAIFLFLTPGFIFGATPFEDYFDTYDIGNLAGQGGWTTTTPPYFYAQTTTTDYHSADISVYWDSSADGEIIKNGDAIGEGRWSFWIKINSDTGTHYEWTNILLKGEGLSTPTYLRFECWPGGDGSDCRASDTIFVKIPIPTRTTFCEMPLDEYVNFQVEWASSTNSTRWKCGDDEWTSYYTDTAFDDIRGFELMTGEDTGKLQFNLDSIGETSYPQCDSEHCNLCEVYSTCSNAGCYWYYSIYLQEYYCVEPFTPDAEACGSFFKCQYCLTQTPCEAELNCEWIDIGYGEKCYMTEPTIPPGQVEWEAPDIEDCGELSGVELWLCEIKNDIAGAFMPSQAKVETLYQTIGAFKEKFPFNYIAGLNSFFTNVSEGLETPTTIPIEILGATSTVSFTFWNSTTTIGGEEETFKNVLYDFTTFVILMCWFVWLISLIKRFF